jgi:catechol 2,3-dioxygenase-like lactoylglutathione lyase family enzyme
MARIRHIALATRNPDAAAEFYQRAFGFKEVGKFSAREADGYYLTDGALNMALLKFKPGALDQLGKGLDYTGLHHFGLLVDDVKAWTARLESMGAECFMRAPDHPGKNHFEVKFRGPDGVVFDIAQHPWPGAAAIEVEAAE